MGTGPDSNGFWQSFPDKIKSSQIKSNQINVGDGDGYNILMYFECSTWWIPLALVTLLFGEEMIEFLAKTWMESPRWQLRTPLLAESHGRIRRTSRATFKARDLVLGFLVSPPTKTSSSGPFQVLPSSLRRGDRFSNATDWI